jgi:enamine deaminase RidA (YjgF/YER057c/UK114 family)
MTLSFFRPTATLGLLLSGAGLTLANAQVIRHGAQTSSPILSGVTVSAGLETLYLSGQVPPVADASADATSPAAYGDTKSQAIGIFRKIETLLKAQGYAVGDVVKLTVFLVGDPKLDGKQDFKGFSEAYSQFFGTADQPNKVARSTVQVAALANPGFLVEIEATAVKAK